MEPLVIIGASGHGREVLDVVEAVNRVEPTWDFLGFLDDGQVDEARLARRDAEVLGGTATLETLEARYLIGIADPAVRRSIDERVSAWGREPATAVHPAASLGSDNRLAPGVVVMAGARVTTNVTLGRHVHLNVNASVSHDCMLGDYVTVNPGAMVSGAVTAREGAYLGVGCSINQNLTIGEWAVVGAGAVVIRDLPARVTAVGVPAAPLDRLDT